MGFKVTEQQKQAIIILHKYEGKDIDEIRTHESMKRPDGTFHRKETIKLWLDRLNETGAMVSKPKSGRPRKLNREQEGNLIKYIQDNPKKRYPQIKKETGLNISPRTINRRANEHGIKTFRCIKRPILNSKNRKDRYFMSKNLLKHPYLIDRIIFTDEKKFMNNNESNLEYVNRLPGQAYKKE